jgi:hypothetical protein
MMDCKGTDEEREEMTNISQSGDCRMEADCKCMLKNYATIGDSS